MRQRISQPPPLVSHRGPQAYQEPEEAKAQIEPLRAALKSNPQIARYVGEVGAGWDPFPSQVGQ